jgi:nucleoside-diphosphate-sugar epimerase
MKIAVLGGSGYIGSKLCLKLLSLGHEVTCISRKIESINILLLKNYKALEHDISSDCSNVNLYEYFNMPDIVIDAAWSDLDNYSSPIHIEKTLKCHFSNIENLVKNGLMRLTILGTCAEYGLQESELDETMETFPVTNYAIAKDTYRKKVSKLKDSFEFHFNWARIFYFYGLAQPRGAIYSQLMNSNNGIFNMSSGEQVRDYLYIDDVVIYLCKIATSKNEIGLINVCSGRPIKLKEIVKQWVLKYDLEVDINLGYYDYAKDEPFSFWGSVSKLKKFNING